MSTSYVTPTTDTRWQRLRLWLTIVYLIVAVILLIASGAGQLRLLSETGKVFGGFFWATDADNGGNIVVVATPPQLPPLQIAPDPLTNASEIVAVNNVAGAAGMVQAYEHTRPGAPISYTVAQNNGSRSIFTRPAVTFTRDMWWQSYGLLLLAGISWLFFGAILLATASAWRGAVQGLTMLPVAMLFLLSSHFGAVQALYPQDAVVQLLWIPAFALLGAALVHLSVTFVPEGNQAARGPQWMRDGLPYLSLCALVLYEWGSFLLTGQVPMRTNLFFSLGYAGAGGVIALCIGTVSMIRVGRRPHPNGDDAVSTTDTASTAPRLRRQVSEPVILWVGGITAGLALGVLPFALMGHALLPPLIFPLAAAIYPLVLWYAAHSLRLIERLRTTLVEQEREQEQDNQALREQLRTSEALYRANSELKQATSLLLRADASLRSALSQRIHDQPRQQALRIRSLLGHWQHKLRVEAEHDPEGKVPVQPIIEALGKVRKVSEELEGDLRALQLLVEDVYQRQSLGLKLHLEKLLREDLPSLHPESPLKIQADLWALDALSPDLEQTEQGAKIAEAISYAVTQALLNIYAHAGANFATLRTVYVNDVLEIYITDDGKGFDIRAVPPEKTSLFKAQLKVREAGGIMTIKSILRPQFEHGTTILIRIPLPAVKKPSAPRAPLETERTPMNPPGPMR